MIPISWGHNHTQLPIGRMVERDGKQILEFMPEAKVSVDAINRINGQLAPSYIITKEKDGVVLECELIAFAVVPKPPGAIS